MKKEKKKITLTSWWAILIYGVVGAYLLTQLGNLLNQKFPNLNFPAIILSFLVIFIISLLIFEIGKFFKYLYKLIKSNNEKLNNIEKLLKKGKIK